MIPRDRCIAPCRRSPVSPFLIAMMRLLLCSLAVCLLSGSSSAAAQTVLEQRLTQARQAAQNPKAGPEIYEQRASALLRRARETADLNYCADAHRAVDRALELHAQAFSARKLSVAVELCEQRWKEALEQAQALNKLVPDDIQVYVYLADAEIALGRYDAALKTTQRLIDFRQVNPQALQRGAELRQIFGHFDLALDWWNSALRLTSPTDVEERAWILTRIARANRLAGKTEAARASARQALELQTDYPWALDEIALAALNESHNAEAVDALRQRQTVGPSLPGLYLLGRALSAAGRIEESRAAFNEFEHRAVSMLDKPVNANLALVQYYTYQTKRVSDALRIAEQELQAKPTLEAREVYAHALEAHGDFLAAAEQMRLALGTGFLNPEWLFEAGLLARESGNAVAAREWFQKALAAGPSGPLQERLVAEVVKTGS